MSLERIKAARQRMKSVRKVRLPNKLRHLRMEALSVLDTRRPTRVNSQRNWVLSYIALKTR